METGGKIRRVLETDLIALSTLDETHSLCLQHSSLGELYNALRILERLLLPA